MLHPDVRDTMEEIEAALAAAIWAVRNATPDQAADFITDPPGSDIWWPQLDEGLYIPDALEGRYGNQAWMDHVHRRTTTAA